MSHVKTTEVICQDLECLKKAVSLFPKLKWKEAQKKFEWFGEWVQDYSQTDAAYKHGIDPSTYGQCDHCVELDGCKYSIGVVKRADGQGYSLVWDFWGCGRIIDDYIGHSGEKLMTAYNTEYVAAYAAANGYMLQQEINAEGNIVMTMLK